MVTKKLVSLLCFLSAVAGSFLYSTPKSFADSEFLASCSSSVHELEIVNNSDDDASFAFAYQRLGSPGEIIWEAEGWRSIRAGQQRVVYQQPGCDNSKIYVHLHTRSGSNVIPESYSDREVLCTSRVNFKSYERTSAGYLIRLFDSRGESRGTSCDGDNGVDGLWQPFYEVQPSTTITIN